MIKRDSPKSDLYRSYRCGIEGLPHIILADTAAPVLIKRDRRPERWEQYLLSDLPAEPFLSGDDDTIYRLGRGLSYIYTYCDVMRMPFDFAPLLSAWILAQVPGDADPVGRTLATFDAWMASLGFEPTDDQFVPFSEAYRTYVASGGDPALDVRSDINRPVSHALEDIEADIDWIVGTLERADTFQALWLVLYPLLMVSDESHAELNLSTPYKTMMYLLALVLQTQQGRRSIPNATALELYTRLERIVSFYRDLPSWRVHEARDAVSATARAFVKTNFNAPLISAEQERRRILELFSLYPEAMRREFGLDSAEIDAVLSALFETLEAQAVSMRQWGTQFYIKPSAWRRFCSMLRRALPWRNPQIDGARSLIEPFCFRVEQLPVDRRLARTFIGHLSAGRGAPLEYRYFAGDSTRYNPAEERPIVALEKGRFFLPRANPLLHAVHTRGLRAIGKSGNTRLRDRYLEAKVAELFGRLFPSAHHDQSVTLVDVPGESDLLIRHGRKLIVVESKAGASPLVLRDPDRSFARISRALDADDSPLTGVGQAQRLIRRIIASEQCVLHDRSGSPLVLRRDELDEYYAVCITLFDWAPFVIDWTNSPADVSRLGEPWVVDFDKLETFANGLFLRGWSGDDLLVYLRERYAAHGKIVTFDELDYVANFILDGSLASIMSTRHAYVFGGRGPSELFDAIEMLAAQRQPMELPACERPCQRNKRDR